MQSRTPGRVQPHSPQDRMSTALPKPFSIYLDPVRFLAACLAYAASDVPEAAIRLDGLNGRTGQTGVQPVLKELTFCCT